MDDSMWAHNKYPDYLICWFELYFHYAEQSTEQSTELFLDSLNEHMPTANQKAYSALHIIKNKHPYAPVEEMLSIFKETYPHHFNVIFVESYETLVTTNA